MRRQLGIVFLLLVLTGCGAGGRFVPVYGTGELTAKRGYYVVKRGDTLYSIAFRFGLDYKALARANDIAPPYTIYIDQQLRLTERVAARDDGPPPTAKQTPSERPKAAAPKSGSRTIDTPAVADSNIDWQWPYEGEVVGRFSLSGPVNKGIDIKGRSGDAVRSSAAGIVVYAGGGLRGYGKLVIVKHNERYLSAYGHNESILVKEGDRVKRGQVVARIGGPNGDQDVLHFEIRRDGQPRDPLDYLPSRT